MIEKKAFNSLNPFFISKKNSEVCWKQNSRKNPQNFWYIISNKPKLLSKSGNYFSMNMEHQLIQIKKSRTLTGMV
jgi:hypothetical protein